MPQPFRAKIFEVEQGHNEVVLNEERAVSLGLSHFDRVMLRGRGKKVAAIVDFSAKLIKYDEVGLFEEVAEQLGVKNGEIVSLEPIHRPNSLDYIKKKLDNQTLKTHEIDLIIQDLMQEKLAATDLAAFIAAIYTNGMNTEETASLTNAICKSGDVLEFEDKNVVSAHSIGGVSGDRVTMVIVPIMASLGIKIPKTASRAISSASGTADAMEVLTNVTLDVKQIRKVVMKTNGCLVWGGAVHLASADDKLIRIRNPLRLDPKPLLLSSILAKKKAEGARFVIIDIPVGRGAKIQHIDEGRELAKSFEQLGSHLGMKVQCIISDGSEPLIPTIGPALEARAVLETLEQKHMNLLLEKSCLMCGVLLHLVKKIPKEEGYRIALEQVKNGKALEKLQEIMVAQGGKRKKSSEIVIGPLRATIRATERGKIGHVDNKAVSKLCRMLGAPQSKEAGMIILATKGQHVEKGQPVAELVSNSKEKLEYALRQVPQLKLFEVERIIIDVV
ncbi:AMP phosphorylase [Candidatus Micrarchaeota archaeon]|nr:AMP phosphorylase [Candidatus Micrarchaeota archaeon]